MFKKKITKRICSSSKRSFPSGKGYIGRQTRPKSIKMLWGRRVKMLPRQQLPRIYKLFWWQQNCFYCQLLRTRVHITPRRTGVSGSHRHTGDKPGKNASFCEQNHPDGHSSSPKDSPNLPSTIFLGGCQVGICFPRSAPWFGTDGDEATLIASRQRHRGTAALD